MLIFLGLVTACANGVYIETDQATQLIARAQRLLEEKNYRQVIRVLDAADGWHTTQAIKDLRLELIAVAHVRSNNAEEGLNILSRLVKRKSSPLRMARYAEALFATGDRWRRWDARKILEKFERKDMMPDAESWAVLAAIRRAEKDEAAETRALSRCRAISADPGLCAAVEPQS